MTETASDEPSSGALGQHIREGECLVGRVAALATLSAARGRTQQARRAQAVLVSAAALLQALYTLRSRSRQDGRAAAER